MRRPIKHSRQKLAAESQRLVNLAVAVAQSSSRYEDQCWQRQLDEQVIRSLHLHHQDILDGATEHLLQKSPNGYEVLAETMETVSTSLQFEHEGKPWRSLLIAAPVLAWTRFEIASGPLSADMQQQFAHCFSNVLLAPDARLRLLPHLFSIEQLPRQHCETFALLEQQTAVLMQGKTSQSTPENPPTVPFLADVRFLMAVVAVPEGAPLFRWQLSAAPFDTEKAKDAVLKEWTEQTEKLLHRLIPGCNTEPLLPECYFSACREADLRIRPVSLQSAVYYLGETFELHPDSIRAVIAGFRHPDTPETGDEVDEYRIGFAAADKPEILYGVVWPLYQPDDKNTAVQFDEAGRLGGEISDLLRECGIVDIIWQNEIYDAEFCDDCGTPMFADADGELVHPEAPDDTPAPGTAHFH